MPPNRVTLVAHTHWDREWYQPFETFRAHLVEVIDEALDVLESDDRLAFTLDGHVALVDDYLEMRPEAEPRLHALVARGRLHIGPWYTQADTLLADGESIIRNLALGIRRGDQLGGAMRLGYMPDQFGHAAQLPQLLRLFGIDGAVLWRGVGPDRPPHAFRWVGPDGSAVTALWLQDGYGSGRRLPSDPEGFAEAVERSLERLGPWIGEMPILIPVGDDHVRLAAWLPEAAAALRARRPELDVRVGGYHDHLPQLGAVTHVVRGELRSPAFAPVLAGVASARIREKQAAARAVTLLERYAEPLAAWATVAGGAPARGLLQRAWKQLLLNHAHDSVAGCGIDAAHEDVKARYRWAEQLAIAARDQALASLGTPSAGDVIAFHPGPAAPSLVVEAQIPRAWNGALVAVGPDGRARAVQSLGVVDERPIFEGEFSAAELGQYLGGLDPATPLFGKFLTGIATTVERPGLVRMDVGLGDAPVGPTALVEDQRRVQKMMGEVERFHIVLHASGTTRPVLLQAGGAPEAALVAIAVRPGEPDADLPRAGVLDGEAPGICAGSLRVVARPDGTVLISDEVLGLGPVCANELVDDGDRGDLYHFDRAGAPVRARAARVEVIERGPVRARLRIEQTLDLPLGLSADRSGRAATTVATPIVTEVTLIAGERRVELTTTFDNQVTDHRLRALVHVPIRAERLDVDHGLAVAARPLDPSSALGAGSERAAPTGQHHAFVDISDGKTGLALYARGLPEHEVIRENHDQGTRLALTLLRSVGWLSRGDLSVIDHAAGPMVPTPGAQEIGAHRFEYALMFHRGDWEEGEVLADARRFAAPPIAVAPKGKRTVTVDRPLVELAPRSVVLSAAHPALEGRGVVVRVLNAAPRAVDATLRTSAPVHDATFVDPLERPVAGAPPLPMSDGTVRLALGPWQLATILLRLAP